ncbi:hypothetical protein BDW62DRAFT_121351 [Aspergillus aurantiobrunneus]
MSSVKGSRSPCVQHIRRSDEADSYVLLHVSCSNSDIDSTALELNITATEGESPYTTTIRQSQLKKLRAKNYQGSDKEWEDIFLHVLGLQEEPAKDSELLTGIITSASINGSGNDDRELVMTVRKKIQTITQKLGSLNLPQNNKQSIELFEWSNLAITRADIIEQRFNSLLVSFRTAENTINLLNKQLEEFISSKNQHEQQLISDFVQLLNEKKLKIRNQQRLLACAKVDPQKVSIMQAATASDVSRPDMKGRKSKRPAETIVDETDSEDGFEKMETDKLKQQAHNDADEATDDEGRSTPQPLEDEDKTASDDEESAPSLKGSHPQRRDRRRQGPSEQVIARSTPPRRELPFVRKTEKRPTPTQPSLVRQDLDEIGVTDDDEL